MTSDEDSQFLIAQQTLENAACSVGGCGSTQGVTEQMVAQTGANVWPFLASAGALRRFLLSSRSRMPLCVVALGAQRPLMAQIICECMMMIGPRLPWITVRAVRVFTP